jgi:hypothetical protein
MKEQIDALTELTLAIARAAAEANPGFKIALGTTVRGSLCWNTSRPLVFQEILAWLEHFESEAVPEGSRQAQGSTESVA